MPVNDEIKNTHIIYGGNRPDHTSQIWSIDTLGSRNLLVDTPQTFNIWGLGFLKNGYDFVVISDTGPLLSDLSGKSLAPVSMSDVQSGISFTSPLWLMVNNLSDPTLTGNRYSPDNKKVAVWKLEDPFLMLRDIESGNEKNILSYDKTGYIDGAWSPDGAHYAITRTRIFRGEHSQAFIMDPNGNNFREIAKFDNKALGHPYWSPDSSKIVFTLWDDLNFMPYEFVVFSLDTAELSRYKVDVYAGNSSMADSDIIWSPDNKWILFYTGERLLEYSPQRHAFYPNDLRAMDLQTGKMYCLTQDMDVIDIRFADWR